MRPRWHLEAACWAILGCRRGPREKMSILHVFFTFFGGAQRLRRLEDGILGNGNAPGAGQHGPKMAPRSPKTASMYPQQHRKTQGKSTFSLVDCIDTPRWPIMMAVGVLMQFKIENVDFHRVFRCFSMVLVATLVQCSAFLGPSWAFLRQS